MNEKKQRSYDIRFLVSTIMLVTLLLMSSCQPSLPQTVTLKATPSSIATDVMTLESTDIFAPEQPVQYIQLQGEIAGPDAELSGLAWYGDTLILLPQYPDRFGKDSGAFFALPKQEILDYLDGANQTPLEPTLIHLNAPKLKKSIDNFQGYESIAFRGDQVFVTIEAGKGTDMHGYLASGTISPDLSNITLNLQSLIEIPLPIQSKGRSDEAIVILGNSIVTLFEANGLVINPNPIAEVFDLNLKPLGSIPFPNIEYRITDAAAIKDDSFWVIDQLTSDNPDLVANDDPLVDKYGQGRTHSEQDQVERLIKLNYSPDGITLADTPPIQLVLDGSVTRKWEGLALLDNLGFLLVTDKSPKTLLAFVKRP